MADPVLCPYCGAKPYLHFNFFKEPNKCPRCELRDVHNHEGVLEPKACGPFTNFLIRLFRWCFLKEPHLHFNCSRCHGKWVTPPIGVKGEPILKKPVKPKTRFEREDVI